MSRGNHHDPHWDYLWHWASNADATILRHHKVAAFKNHEGRTPLHVLAEKGCVEVLQHPMVAKVRDAYGKTPLHDLAGAGVVAVLSYPCIDDIRDDYERTPIHFLAERGNKDALELLASDQERPRWRIARLWDDSTGGDKGDPVGDWSDAKVPGGRFFTKEDAIGAIETAVDVWHDWGEFYDENDERPTGEISVEFGYKLVDSDGEFEDEYGDFVLRYNFGPDDDEFYEMNSEPER